MTARKTNADCVRVLAVSGFLGYGFPEESFWRGIEASPDLIACDAGTNDAGAYYLGTGSSMTSRAACQRDLTLMLDGARRIGAPVVVGSAWTSGSDQGVDLLSDIVAEIARSSGQTFRLARVYSEVRPTELDSLRSDGNLVGIGKTENITAEDLHACTRIVCAMGAEPLIAAIEEGADVVIAGRASDAALFASLPLMRGMPPERVWHAGKILECGACSADPGDSGDCLVAEIGQDAVHIWAPNPDLRCTTTSVSAHTLYENRNPFFFREPSGTLDLRAATYDQRDERTVRVGGKTSFEPQKYSMRLEGAIQRGYRAVTFGGIRDPRLVQNSLERMKVIRADIEERIRRIFGQTNSTMRIVLYGANGVMGGYEPIQTPAGHELGVLLDVIADTQERANEVLAVARAFLVHADFPGRLNLNAGNVAFPFSPSDVEVGMVFEFLKECVVIPENPLQLVRIEIGEVGG